MESPFRQLKLMVKKIGKKVLPPFISTSLSSVFSFRLDNLRKLASGSTFKTAVSNTTGLGPTLD
jgi:hypothetical protein